MNKQSGSVSLIIVFTLSCVSAYALGYFGCNHEMLFERDPVQVDVIYLEDKEIKPVSFDLNDNLETLI